MSLYVRLLLALLIAGTGGLVAWNWQTNAYEKKLSDLRASHSDELARMANANARQLQLAVERQQMAEQNAAALDKKATEEKADALAKNESLRKLYDSSQTDNGRLHADVIAGYNRLRIAGSCTANTGNLSQASSTSGLGDASTVKLSPATGQTVFDIRAGIIADQAALITAQNYIRDVCPTGK
jgi:prophage endopeptidase